MKQLEFEIGKQDQTINQKGNDDMVAKKKKRDRTNSWQKNGVGRIYKGQYFYNGGERVLVLIGAPKKGSKKPHMVTAESWQMLKKAGWKKL